MEIFNFLKNLDTTLDYIPIASTASNLIALFEKLVFRGPKEEISAQEPENKYVKHIRKKSVVRCVILLVPFLGNVVVAVWDSTKEKKTANNSDDGIPHNKPPESIKKLFDDPSTPDYLDEVKRWQQARSTVIVYEKLKEENNNLGYLDTSLLESDGWEKLFDLYVEWSEKNRNKLQNITKLNLMTQRLLFLPKGIFRNLDNLEKLDLWNNNLQELPDESLANLRKLKWLELGCNEIRVLPKGVFDNLRYLERLGLGKNGLRELPKRSLDNLSNLEWLFLNDNGLEELPEGFLDNLRNLEILSLSRNKFRKLPNGALDKLGNLEILFLTGNQLSELHKELFDKLDKLQELDLSGNKIGKNRPALKKLPAATRISI